MASHLTQDHVAPRLRALRKADRVIEGWVLQHPDKRGRLRNFELIRALPKQRLRRCFDAEGIVHELDRVQVHLDYLTLRIAALETYGRHHFFELTCDGDFAPDVLVVHIPGELLRDR